MLEHFEQVRKIICLNSYAVSSNIYKNPILLMPKDFKQENQNFFLFKNILNMHTCNHLIQLFFFSKSNNECLMLTTNSFSILFRKITPAAVIWLNYSPYGVKHFPINQSIIKYHQVIFIWLLCGTCHMIAIILLIFRKGMLFQNCIWFGNHPIGFTIIHTILILWSLYRFSCIINQ